MTRDVFDTNAGTLDIIVFAVLASLDLTRLPLTAVGANTGTLDGRCEANARTFLAHFGTFKIKAIKAIRDVSGLGLLDAKNAYEQIIESYLYDTETDEITRDEWVQAVQLNLTSESFDSWLVRENNRRKLEALNR